MNLWEKVKKDLKKGTEEIDWDKITGEVQAGIKKGMATVRKGTAAVKEKAEELTEEGKKQYKLITLKKKVHELMPELGGKVYELSLKTADPMNNTTVKLIIKRIKKLESQIAKLEGKSKVAQRKTPVGTTTRSNRNNTLRRS